MPLKAGKPRKKKCANRECRAEFQPERSFQSWCSTDCAVIIARAKQARSAERKAKAERAEHKAAKEKVKRRSDWLREAQQAVNAFIRERDKDQPCISCQRHHDGQYHAGHYRPAGSNPAIRFDESNISKQCQPCNTHLSGNLTNYRTNLIQKIGLEKVEWLEGPHEPRRYNIDELKAIKEEYRAKVRELKKRNDAS